MDVEPLSVVVGLMAMAGLALAISLSAAGVADAPQKPVASASAK
jgi:hypothetical protein